MDTFFTFVSALCILAVLGMGAVSLVLCIYYLGKIAVLTFSYYKLGPEKYHQKMSENPSSHATLGTTNVTATTNKKPRWSFLEFVSNIFGMFP
jgi:hypothetical protein